MIKAIGYRVIILQDKIEERDKIIANAKRQGIVLLDDEREKAAVDSGTVVAVGPDAYKEATEPWCKVGDRVAFAKYSGKIVEDLDHTKYVIVNDDDVVAVLGA